jgi:hypothetical protein
VKDRGGNRSCDDITFNFGGYNEFSSDLWEGPFDK